MPGGPARRRFVACPGYARGMTEIHEQLALAAQEAARLDRGVDVTQLSNPTPCPGYDVRALAAHLMQEIVLHGWDLAAATRQGTGVLRGDDGHGAALDRARRGRQTGRRLVPGAGADGQHLTSGPRGGPVGARSELARHLARSRRSLSAAAAPPLPAPQRNNSDSPSRRPPEARGHHGTHPEKRRARGALLVTIAKRAPRSQLAG